MATFPAKEVPLTSRGKFFLFLGYLLSFAVLGFGIFAYYNLPAKIAVHFNISGQPDRYGNRMEVLVISLLFFVISFLFCLFIQKRYALLKGFPYLINIPAFYLYAEKLGEERKAYWIGQYFEFMAVIMFLTNLLFLIIEFFMYLGGKFGKMPVAFNFVFFFYIAFLLFFTFGYLFVLYRKIKKEAENQEN